MLISCELKDLQEENPTPLPKGSYLYIYSEKSAAPFIISIYDFQKRIEKIERNSDSSLGDQGYIRDFAMSTSLTEKIKPNFKQMVDYISEELKVSDNDFTDGDELIIESRFKEFLELPWEDMVEKNIYVFRRVQGEKKNNYEEPINNLLFILSNSNISNGGKHVDLKDTLKEEVLNIARKCIETIPKDFKINNVHISKHTTKDSFLSVGWDDYNLIHIIMHGSDAGGLCLESGNINSYKIEDIMRVDEVMAILENRKFLLFFLSFCRSCGNDNMAFNFVNKGISKYVIGYKHDVGEKSACNFSQIFYDKLLSCFEIGEKNRIERVYKKALLEYYAMPSFNKNYTPVLYINY